MGNREAVIQNIVEAVGFHFNESEPSPSLRTKIGELAKKQEQLQRLYDARACAKKPLSMFLVRTLIMLGITPLFLGLAVIWINQTRVLGAVLLFSSLLLFLGAIWARKHFKIRDSKIFKDADMELLNFLKEFQADIASFSRLVVTELSETREAKLRPTVRHVVVDFAVILKTMKGKRVLIESIECPHCGAPLSLPKTGESTQCSHCNKTILALDVFEKLKGTSP